MKPKDRFWDWVRVIATLFAIFGTAHFVREHLDRGDRIIVLETEKGKLSERVSELEYGLDEARGGLAGEEEKNGRLSEELERLNSDLSDAQSLADGGSCEDLRDAVSVIDEADVSE